MSWKKCIIIIYSHLFKEIHFISIYVFSIHLHTYTFINTQKKFWKNTQILAKRVGLEIGKGKGLSIFIHFTSVLFAFLPDHIVLWYYIYFLVVSKQLNKKSNLFKEVLYSHLCSCLSSSKFLYSQIQENPQWPRNSILQLSSWMKPKGENRSKLVF